MTAAARPATTRRKHAPKEERRVQLIRATIRSVAKRGLSATTIATVAREARLSHGIINLHFRTKQRLLVETLKYLADEYRIGWLEALESAGPDAAAQLAALVELDFDKSVCDRNKLAVWIAFWGETRSRPTYRKICAEHDDEYMQTLLRLCEIIVREGPYPDASASAVASGLAAMSEGLWLDLLVTPESMNRKRARDICFAWLASIFPRHFPL